MIRIMSLKSISGALIFCLPHWGFFWIKTKEHIKDICREV
jgi:hypothetical protein